jgi:uncharacterized membrane protein
MTEGFSNMDEAAQNKTDSNQQTEAVNPWKAYFSSKKARGFVLLWTLLLVVVSQFGYITTPAEAISFGAGAFAMFAAWAADMKDER